MSLFRFSVFVVLATTSWVHSVSATQGWFLSHCHHIDAPWGAYSAMDFYNSTEKQCTGDGANGPVCEAPSASAYVVDRSPIRWEGAKTWVLFPYFLHSTWEPFWVEIDEGARDVAVRQELVGHAGYGTNGLVLDCWRDRYQFLHADTKARCRAEYYCQGGVQHIGDFLKGA
ncbi:hypothetical protein PG990_010574 [Apiospora arundinis]|uniref:Uncharacterized protein n=1 Tax=Apiospora arundinis TaxID=335852 RepID=A0ABR2IWJ6_9PEZI